jgi:hypothetical protein
MTVVKIWVNEDGSIDEVSVPPGVSVIVYRYDLAAEDPNCKFNKFDLTGDAYLELRYTDNVDAEIVP